MIPKKIHYCWFGRSPLPRSAQNCIDSWKKYMPDYEIIRWDEDSFDVNSTAYTKMCCDTKKYAYLSDYVRLVVVEREGGIYFDTDVEVLRSFDDLLDCAAFFGFENEKNVTSGLGFGAEAGSIVLKQMIEEYAPLSDGRHGVIGCPKLNTQALKKFGLVQNGQKQYCGDAVVYPTEYFNPKDSATGKLHITKNTYSIHHYSMLCIPTWKRRVSKITRVFHRIFGENCFNWLKKLLRKE